MNAFDYYNDGFAIGKFKGESLKVLTDVFASLFAKDLREGFSFEQKYPNTFDLRPNVHLYDPCFIDALIEADVPSMLKACVGSDLTLYHTQVRVSGPGSSYMDWHRDAYNYGKYVGNFPPAHKVIFYPALSSTTQEPKLKLCKGSHLRNFHNQRDDTACLLDGPNQLPCELYYASNDKFIMFNTSMLHGACADSGSSIRVIYSFIRRVQLEALYSDQQIHVEQAKMYEERLAK